MNILPDWEKLCVQLKGFNLGGLEYLERMSEEYRPPHADGGTDLAADSESTADERPSKILDDVFEAMADPTRRRALEYLRASPGTVPVSELVDALSPLHAERADRDELKITLFHSALPKLAALGFVEHDAERGTVEYEGGLEIDACLELVAQVEAERR